MTVTCTESGKTEGTHCSVCGTVIKEQETVPALGHVPVIDEAVAPTCTETGLTEGTHCSRCNAVIKSQETVPATGHSYKPVVTPPTCTEQGYTTYTCECGDSYVDDNVPALGHDYKALVTAPKANAVGYTQYKCACGEWQKDAKGNVLKDTFTAPTGKPTGFKCASRTATAEKFTWTKTAGVNGYQIQLLTSAGKSAGLKALTANSYTFSKLAAGHAYKARVRFFIKAADGKNYYGPWTTINSPTLPAGTAITKLTPAKKAFTAQWKKGAVTGYQLQYSTNKKFTGAKTVTIKKPATINMLLRASLPRERTM